MIKRLLLIMTLLGSCLVLQACDDGPAENAGEEVDEAIDEIEDELD